MRERRHAVVIAAAALVLAGWLTPFLREPGRLPQGPDTAWYVWRTEMLVAHPPQTLIETEGPLRAFGGGYRIANPILAGTLRSAGDTAPLANALLFAVGWSVMGALVVGGIAYSIWRSAWAFASAALVAGALFMRSPFVGFSDAMLALTLLGASVAFFRDTHGSWPARVAVFLLSWVAFFAHPPAVGIFTGAVVAALGITAWRRHRRGAFRTEAVAILPLLAGVAAGYLSWRIGVWGIGRPLESALTIPPIAREDFLAATRRWTGALQPPLVVPLVLIGALALARGAGRRAARVVAVWSLPVLGLVAALAGMRFPAHRLLSVSLGPIVLAGAGLWALSRWLGGRHGWVGRGASVLLVVLVLGSMWGTSLSVYGGRTGWLPEETRDSLAGVRAYLETRSGSQPVVLVIPAGSSVGREPLYSRVWRGRWSRVRAGIPGPDLPDTYLYLGTSFDFLQGRPAETDNPFYNLLSEASFQDLRQGVAGREPVAIEITFRSRPPPLVVTVPEAMGEAIDRNVTILRGPGLAEPESAALAAARRAVGAARDESSPPIRPLHSLRILLVLVLLLVAPGALALPWFGVRSPARAVAVVPALSVASAVAWGVVVLGVTGRPLDLLSATVILGLSVVSGAVARILAGRRAAHPGSGQEGGQDGDRPQEAQQERRVVVLEPDGVVSAGNGDGQEESVGSKDRGRPAVDGSGPSAVPGLAEHDD
jgi:hypothetical protein